MESVVIERGIIARARSQDLPKDDATLDRYLGLQLQAPLKG